MLLQTEKGPIFLNRHERRARGIRAFMAPVRRAVPRYVMRHAMVFGIDAVRTKPWQGESRREQKIAARVRRIMARRGIVGA